MRDAHDRPPGRRKLPRRRQPREAAARDEREDEARHHDPFGPLTVHDHLGVVRREAVYMLLKFFLIGDQG